MPRTRMRGIAAMRLGRNGGSSDDGAAMVSSPSGALSTRASDLASETICSTCGNTCRPAELSAIPRAPRVKSRTRSAPSRREMALLTCDGVTPSSRATDVTDPVRYTCRNVDRSWRFSSAIRFA